MSWWHFSKQHLPWRHLSISRIFQLLLTWFWQNSKGMFLGPPLTDANCHSEIFPLIFSGTKYFGLWYFLDHNYSRLKISFDSKFCWPKFSWLNFFYTKLFWSKKFCGPKVILVNLCLRQLNKPKRLVKNHENVPSENMAVTRANFSTFVKPPTQP